MMRNIEALFSADSFFGILQVLERKKIDEREDFNFFIDF